MRLRQRIRKWWEGETIVYKNPPGETVIILSAWQKRHWTARIARACVAFVTEHWKFLVTTTIAVLALLKALGVL